MTSDQKIVKYESLALFSGDLLAFKNDEIEKFPIQRITEYVLFEIEILLPTYLYIFKRKLWGQH